MAIASLVPAKGRAGCICGFKVIIDYFSVCSVLSVARKICVISETCAIGIGILNKKAGSPPFVGRGRHLSDRNVLKAISEP